MKRIFNYLLGLNNLRKFCGNAVIFKCAKTNFKLEILDKPKSGKALVLAPHPDDDVFGCGGSLVLHAEQNDQVKVIYLAGADAKKFPIKEEGSINRQAEAREAAKVLKISDIEFWGLMDNKFVADDKNVQRLKKVIDNYKPEIIYCPSFTDINPDHYEVGKMLHSVIERSQRQSNLSNRLPRSSSDDSLAMTTILLYEVWSPICVNRLVKIDSVIEQKKVAIKCHKSQLSNRSYLDAIIGLNRYRAGMFKAGKYAEGFTEMSVELYVKLFEKYQLKK